MANRKINKAIAYILGVTCFTPVFITVIIVGAYKPLLSVILLIITQLSWLISISLLAIGLEIENKNLKKKINGLEGK